MDYKRVNEILKSKDLKEIYYEDKPIWIQEIHNNTATIGFLDGTNSQDVFISELYEDDSRPQKGKKQF